MLQNAGVLYILTCKCASPHSGVPFWTSYFQKVARKCGVLHILTCQCASRHSDVPFLTSKMAPRLWCFVHFDWQMCLAPQRRSMFRHQNFKNAPRMWCFVHFDFKMCFLPQRRAISRHQNFKKCSENVVFCAFWLANVLRATAACHFSGSQLQKWFRHWGVLSILPYKCASRHSGVPFFTCLLNSYLRTRRFSKATFRTSGTTNHWKITAILGVANISRACTCFLLTLRACWSPFCWLDISTLLDTSTLLFNSAYYQKLDF